MRFCAKTVRLRLARSAMSAQTTSSRCTLGRSSKSKLCCSFWLRMREPSTACISAWVSEWSSSGNGTGTPSSSRIFLALRRMTFSTTASTGLLGPYIRVARTTRRS